DRGRRPVAARAVNPLASICPAEPRLAPRMGGMARARILRALVALYVVAILSPLLTTGFDHSCALGRFMIDDGSGLAVGPIELRDGILLLDAGCTPARMTVTDEGREGTRVRTA